MSMAATAILPATVRNMQSRQRLYAICSILELEPSTLHAPLSILKLEPSILHAICSIL